MTHCCSGEAERGRFARRFLRFGGPLLTGLALALLPKCPLCLALWLTALTGIRIAAAGANWLWWGLLLVWMASLLPAIRRLAARASKG